MDHGDDDVNSSDAVIDDLHEERSKRREDDLYVESGAVYSSKSVLDGVSKVKNEVRMKNPNHELITMKDMFMFERRLKRRKMAMTSSSSHRDVKKINLYITFLYILQYVLCNNSYSTLIFQYFIRLTRNRQSSQHILYIYTYS